MDESPANFVLDQAQYEDMLAHVLACLPEEACGLLGGQMNGSERIAQLVIPIENVLHSPVRFRMDPRKQLEAFTYFESQNMEMVGIFHSHPTGPDAPSLTDLAEFFYPGVAFLIWSPGADGWRLRAFRIDGKDAQAEKSASVIPIQVGKP